MSVEVLEGCDTGSELGRDDEVEEHTRPRSSDPTINCDTVGPRPERVYTFEVLRELKLNPLSQQWPWYLDPKYRNPRGLWDPAKWHESMGRKSPTSSEEGERPNSGAGDLRPDQPVKKLRDKTGLGVTGGHDMDIILSPQRRSFLDGCQAAPTDDLVLKPEIALMPSSAVGGGGVGGVGGGNTRRVGSGRILARDRPSDEDKYGRGHARGDEDGKYGSGRMMRDRGVDEDKYMQRNIRGRNEMSGGGRMDKDRDPRGPSEGGRDWGSADRDYGGKSFVRRGMGMDDDGGGRGRGNYFQHDDRDPTSLRPNYIGSGRMMNNSGQRRDVANGNGRFNAERGGRGHRMDAEPEWMNATVSINDMMELRGFEEPQSKMKPGGILEELEQQAVGAGSKRSKPRDSEPVAEKQSGGSRSSSRLSNRSDRAGTVPRGEERNGSQQPPTDGGGSGGGMPKGILDSILDDGSEKQDDGFNYEDVSFQSLLGSNNAISPEDLLRLVGINHLRNVPANESEDHASKDGLAAAMKPAGQSKFSQFFSKPQSAEQQPAMAVEGMLEKDALGAMPMDMKARTAAGESLDEGLLAKMGIGFLAPGGASGGGEPSRGGGPAADSDSRRSSIQDELLGSNILREINGEPSIIIPPSEESNKYFTPISPAAKTASVGHLPHAAAAAEGNNIVGKASNQGGNDLLEMLKGPSHPPKGDRMVQQMEDDLKRSLGLNESLMKNPQQYQQQLHQLHIHNLLAQAGQLNQQHAGMMHQLQLAAGQPRPQAHHMHQHQEPEDMSAFNKLVAQVKSGTIPTADGNLGRPSPQSGIVRPSPMPPAGLPFPLGGGGGGAPGGGMGLPLNALTEQELLEGHVKPGAGARPPVPSSGGGMPPNPAVVHTKRRQLSGLPPGLQQALDQMPLNKEILKRPEAEQLLIGLNNGSITIENLVNQLNSPGLQPRQQELILNVMKVRVSGGGQMIPGIGGLLGPHHHNMPPNSGSAAGAAPPNLGPLAGLLPPPRTSPLPSPGGVDPMGFCPGGSRVSPLMFPHALGGGPGGAANHLAVSPVPQNQRVPSPQEMTMLTQHIMQQALIKRKLEEQKENYRRRQGEMGKQDRDKKDDREEGARGSGGSHNPATGSPLAFTPTSVMRKSAAERKDSDPRIQVVPELKISGQNGGGLPQAGSHGDVGEHKPGDGSIPPGSPGRPVVKGKNERPSQLNLGGGGNGSSGNVPTMGQQQKPHSPINPLVLLQQQLAEQQQRMPPHHMMGGMGNFPQQLGMPGGHPGIDPRHIMGRLPPHLQHLHPQQQAAAAGHHPHFGPQQHPPQPHMAAAAGMNPQLSPRGAGAAQPQPMNNSNQLANSALSRFFSPDMLAAAQGGALPSMPPLPTKQALTLGEIERQSAATVRM